jgi:MFS family permease
MPALPWREVADQRFRAFRHPAFRLYWTGQLVSLVGTWMQSVAQGWLLHRLTSSAFMLGFLGFLQFLPVLLLTLWAGVIADHVNKRHLILATQTAALIQAALFALLVSFGSIQAWMVLVLAFVFGIINAFDLPARQSYLVELVGKEDLPNAIAVSSASFNVARILGPAVAGVLLATTPHLLAAIGLGRDGAVSYAGEAACFWVNALSYVAMLVALMRIGGGVEIARGERQATWTTLAEGVRYAWGVSSIRNLLLLLGITGGLGFQFLTLLPVYVRDLLHADANTYGLLVSAFGVGALLAAVLMTRKSDRWTLRRNLLVGLTSSGVGLGVFAWARWLPLSMAMGFLAGFGLILYVASTNTLIQLTTEDRFRGRVMSLYTLMFIGLAPFGALLAGSIAQKAGAPASTTVSAAVLLAGAAWVVYRLRVLAAREAAHPATPVIEERVG